MTATCSSKVLTLFLLDVPSRSLHREEDCKERQNNTNKQKQKHRRTHLTIMQAKDFTFMVLDSITH